MSYLPSSKDVIDFLNSIDKNQADIFQIGRLK